MNKHWLQSADLILLFRGKIQTFYFLLKQKDKSAMVKCVTPAKELHIKFYIANG